MMNRIAHLNGNEILVERKIWNIIFLRGWPLHSDFNDERLSRTTNVSSKCKRTPSTSSCLFGSCGSVRVADRGVCVVWCQWDNFLKHLEVLDGSVAGFLQMRHDVSLHQKTFECYWQRFQNL